MTTGSVANGSVANDTMIHANHRKGNISKHKHRWVQGPPTNLAIYYPCLFGTDVFLVILGDSRMATVLLASNNTMILGLTYAYSGTMELDHQPVCSTVLPYR